LTIKGYSLTLSLYLKSLKIKELQGFLLKI
jgi:hypothetical protein